MHDEIDLALLEQLREEGDGFVRELMEIYASDSATLLEQLRAAVRHGDLGHVRTLAHALKGASLSLGASLAASAAQALERYALQPREGEDPALLLSTLEGAVQRALERLDVLVDDAAG